MTFDDVRKFALTWPEVEDGTSYGTPALKVRKKMLARLKEDGDSLVMPAGREPAENLLFHRSLCRLSDRADPPLQGQARGRGAIPAATLARVGLEGGASGI
jgi:hypothetical protein